MYISICFIVVFCILVSNVVLHIAHADSPIDGAIQKSFGMCNDYDTCVETKSAGRAANHSSI